MYIPIPIVVLFLVVFFAVIALAVYLFRDLQRLQKKLRMLTTAATGQLTIENVQIIGPTQIRVTGTAIPLGSGNECIKLYTKTYDTYQGVIPKPPFLCDEHEPNLGSGHTFNLTVDIPINPLPDWVYVWGAFGQYDDDTEKFPRGTGTGTGTGSAYIAKAGAALFDAAPRTYQVSVEPDKGSAKTLQRLSNLVLAFDERSSFAKPVWRYRGRPGLDCRLEFCQDGDTMLAVLHCVLHSDNSAKTMRWATDEWNFQKRNRLKYLGKEGMSELLVEPK